MATTLTIPLGAYLLVGAALGIRWHGFRGGVWIVVIVMTSFTWPLTLWAVHLHQKRDLSRFAGTDKGDGSYDTAAREEQAKAA